MSEIDVLSVTPTYSWPIPNPDDPDDVPTDLSELAVAIENTVKGGALVPKPAVNGQWLKGVGGLPVWTALTAADVGAVKVTAGPISAGPPTSPAPVTGDIWTATDVGGAGSGRVWDFRYNAANPTYKWEFVGGTPFYGTQGSALNPAPNAWGAVVAQTIVPPRSGGYLIGATTLLNNPGATVIAATIGLYRNTPATVQAYAAPITLFANSNSEAVVATNPVTLTAGDFLGISAYITAAANVGPSTWFMVPYVVA